MYKEDASLSPLYSASTFFLFGREQKKKKKKKKTV
jgi:hypothetical protein